MSKATEFSPLQQILGRVRLNKIDTFGDGSLTEENVKEKKDADIDRMKELVRQMYAEDRRSLLVVLQGIDASGKNGLTRHLAKGVRPDGLQVHAFGPPSEIELDHDYLWRTHQTTPRRGNVAIFNRSHYEEVIVTRVHPEILEKQKLPPEVLDDPDFFGKRYRQINDFERLLAESGTTIIKLLLHISRDEQIERFRARLEDPTKHWKFNDEDLEKRKKWNEYMHAFESMIEATSTDWAPWFVVPADRKWYRNLLVGDLVVRQLDELPMVWPQHHAPDITLEQMKNA